MEQWKKISGFEDYEISSYGRVRSLKFNKLKLRKPNKDKDGYLKLTLHKKNKCYFFIIHRLVAESFCTRPKYQENLQVDHINNKILDNRYTNLRWVTPKQNCDNRVKKIKLNKQNILKIIKLHNNKYKIKEIIGKF